MGNLASFSTQMAQGLSVFYEITVGCMHDLGFLPSEKNLPEDTALADELHRERILAMEWLSKGGMQMKNQTVPHILDACDVLSACHEQIQSEQTVTDEELQNALWELNDVLQELEQENTALKAWGIKLEDLHQEAVAKASGETDPDFYSWRDAADKLAGISEKATKNAVSWEGLQQLVDGAVSDLKKASKSAADILKNMYTEAALKSWNDITVIAENIVRI